MSFPLKTRQATPPSPLREDSLRHGDQEDSIELSCKPASQQPINSEPADRTSETATLRSDTSWMLAGNTISTASQWLILVLLTKQTTPSDVGYFTLGLTVSAPIIMFLNFDLRGLLGTSTRNSFDFNVYFKLRSITSTLALFTLVTLASIIPSYTDEQRVVIIILAMSKSLESVSDLRLGLFQRQGRLDLVAKSISARGITAAAITTIGLALGGGLLGVCLSILVSQTATYFLIDRRLASSIIVRIPQSDPNRNSLTVWTLLKLALPLGGAMLLISLQSSVPRLLVEYYASASDLGIFAALSYPWALGSLFVHSLGSAAAPRYRRHIDSGDWRALKRQVSQMVGFCLVLSAGGLILVKAIGPNLLRVIYTPEYAEQASVFLSLGIAASLGYVAAVIRHALVALRKLKSHFAVTIGSTAAQLAACLVLIERHGLQGAAQANILMGVLQVVGSVFLLLLAIRGASK